MGSSSSKEVNTNAVVQQAKAVAPPKPQRNFDQPQYDVLRSLELDTEKTVPDKMMTPLHDNFVQRELLRRVALVCGQRCVDYSSSKTFNR